MSQQESKPEAGKTPESTQESDEASQHGSEDTKPKQQQGFAPQPQPEPDRKDT
jgi:hypothetical protein